MQYVLNDFFCVYYSHVGKRTLLLIGSDFHSNLVFREVRSTNLDVVICRQLPNVERQFNLFMKCTFIQKKQFLESICVNYFRKITQRKFEIHPTIRNNHELSEIIKIYQIDKVMMFKVGLIIDVATLSLFPNIFNIHCAMIPKYAGLGAISKALMNHEYSQFAVLYKINEKIDFGDIIDREPYTLEKGICFYKNEDLAYRAGIRLLLRHLS